MHTDASKSVCLLPIIGDKISWKNAYSVPAPRETTQIMPKRKTNESAAVSVAASGISGREEEGHRRGLDSNWPKLPPARPSAIGRRSSVVGRPVSTKTIITRR